MSDDALIFAVAPTDDVDDADEPGMVRAGTRTARGVCVESFGSALLTLNDFRRWICAAISGEMSWSMLIVERGIDDELEFVRLYVILADCRGVCALLLVVVVVVVSAMPVVEFVPGVKVRIRTLRT